MNHPNSHLPVSQPPAPSRQLFALNLGAHTEINPLVVYPESVVCHHVAKKLLEQDAAKNGIGNWKKDCQQM